VCTIGPSRGLSLKNDGPAGKEGEGEMNHRKSVLVAALVCFVAGLGAATSEPKVIHKVAPRYPEEAKKEGVEGSVVLEAVIAEDGAVRETRVVKGEDSRLADAARTAVGQWRFEPVRDEDGDPVAILFTVTIRFALS
jgi:TonB family protein